MSVSHRQTHSLLLLQRLLSSRPGVSPFTLLLDSLGQSSQPVVKEYIARAKVNKITVVLISYETFKPPQSVDFVVRARRKDVQTLQKEVTKILGNGRSNLLIIDTLHPLIHSTLSSTSMSLPFLLTSLTSPTTSILGILHRDIPLSTQNSYSPSPYSLISYLATTLITLHSFSQTLSHHRASARALPVPLFGLLENIEGVLVGLGANGGDLDNHHTSDHSGSVVLELEHRRKSGRGVGDWFVLPAQQRPTSAEYLRFPNKVLLLDDHPLTRDIVMVESVRGDSNMGVVDYASVEAAAEAAAGTFSLSLTERQRHDRADVVLPYFDAQKEGGTAGPGEGGRILYQMGWEDAGDWDSEEDEL